MLKSYIRNHRGSNRREVEEAKIVREHVEAARLNRKAARLLHRVVSEREEASDQFQEKYDTIAYCARKTRRNAKTHKDRLMELKKNEEFQ